MKILVTGAGGFIGRNFIEKLKDKYHIVALEKNKESAIRLRKFGIRVEIVDLLNDELNSRFFQDTELVLHLAGNPSDIPEFSRLVSDNVIVTDKLLACCFKSGVKKIVLASTIDVYGGDGFFLETKLPKPSNKYGLSKFFSEEVCRFYEKNFGISSIILRFSSVYGPENNKGLFFSLLKSIQETQSVRISGTGDQKRNSVYIDDLVRCIDLVLNSHFYGTEIYNVAGKDVFSLNDVVGLLKKTFNFDVSYTKSGKMENSVLDIQKIEKKLGWTPTVSLESGIRKIIENLSPNTI